MSETERNTDWNPGLYLKFRDERTQPSIDLAGRIALDTPPACVLDVGCGPGNSGEVILRRWPSAHLVGVDTSKAMIEKAKATLPAHEWVLADAMEYETDNRFDLVFSNATIQWVPHHRRLLAHFAGMLAEHGAIAIQIPLFVEMAASRVIRSVAGKKRWKKSTAGCAELFTYHDAGYYYDVLAGLMRAVDLWQTDYIHVMESHRSILDWVRATAIRPYLDRIGNDDGRNAFEAEVLDGFTKIYPEQKDGRVLFPFRRLFFIGYR
jgi:trans-aconitate 2-methyltransferase